MFISAGNSICCFRLQLLIHCMPTLVESRLLWVYDVDCRGISSVSPLLFCLVRLSGILSSAFTIREHIIVTFWRPTEYTCTNVCWEVGSPAACGATNLASSCFCFGGGRLHLVCLSAALCLCCLLPLSSLGFNQTPPPLAPAIRAIMWPTGNDAARGDASVYLQTVRRNIWTAPPAHPPRRSCSNRSASRVRRRRRRRRLARPFCPTGRSHQVYDST